MATFEVGVNYTRSNDADGGVVAAIVFSKLPLLREVLCGSASPSSILLFFKISSRLSSSLKRLPTALTPSTSSQ
jgi:hypothetical protein